MKSDKKFLLSIVLFFAFLIGVKGAEKEPLITIPYLSNPPVIDGVLNPEEWKYATKITFFEVYPCGLPMVPRQEQPFFYAGWDSNYIYIAMESIDSSTNTVVASCVIKDNIRIIGDDCVEIMIAPGSEKDLKKIDLPTYYFAINSIGTIWDAKFYPLLAERHNSWDSGVKVANSTDGTYWVCEMAIPIKNLTNKIPEEGTVWRMNFDRTYSGYNWVAWNATGGLNDARIGGNVYFTRRKPIVRMNSFNNLIDGKTKAEIEILNQEKQKQKVKIDFKCFSRRQQGDKEELIDNIEKEVEIPPGKIKRITLGNNKELYKYSSVKIKVSSLSGEEFFYLERQLQIPAPRFVKKVAPEVPLVYIFPRFLPSLERLAVIIDYTAWAKKTGITKISPVAEIKVFARGKEKGKPVFEGILNEFKNNKGVWRHSTKNLSEGEYIVKVKVKAGKETIEDFQDWFVKKEYKWMVNKSGTGDKVPPPYTELKTERNSIYLWGRKYTFSPSGLPSQFISQGRNLLSKKVVFSVKSEGKILPLKVEKPFIFTDKNPTVVKGKSRIKAGDINIEINSSTEYDGFTLFRLTYSSKKAVKISRMRLKISLNSAYTKFYSAAGDIQGTCILGEVIPEKKGKFYDSFNNTRGVCVSPSFATLFWAGDYKTSFCYAADNDKGWKLRDDAPAVEAYRENGQIILYLNLIDKETIISSPQTLEFAFQCGPVKPLPDKWRGIQDGGDPDDALLTIIQIGGGGTSMGGGICFLHPGDTPELRERTRKEIERVLKGGNKAVVGYHFWGTVPKGRDAVRVFRGEWGIDKYTWDTARAISSKYAWENKRFGENKDMYIRMSIDPRPSYVDYITYCYEETLKTTAISGFYDDCGYPKPVFDEELGLGYIREDGKKIYSSGLWIYRNRWKRAAYLNFLYNRPNFLRDSQHVHAHFMPAYGFIGIWAPCERGYYNPFPDRDNLGFYHTVERYAAFNPSFAFGQFGMIGMSTPHWEATSISKDTRNMMMLTMLHDQDLGSFGRRDLRTICRLRAARNIFKPWDEDTEFFGYWENKKFVKTSRQDVLISLYRKNDGVLFILGNTSYNSVNLKVKPDWKSLKLNPEKLNFFNPETGEKIEVKKEEEGITFKVDVPGRDVKLVLAGEPEKYRPKNTDLKGEKLKPSHIIYQVPETIRNEKILSDWEKDIHEGQAGIWIVDGKICVQGDTYGYSHIKRKLEKDNVSIQCLIMGKSSGTSELSWGSLFLYWSNGSYVQAVPGLKSGKFLYFISGKGIKRGSPVCKKSPYGWYPFVANWVKITLKKDKIEFYSSSDGKKWIKDAEVIRGEKFKEAPEYVILGNGHPGPEPYLNNVNTRYFKPEGFLKPYTFFSNFIIGRD